MPGRDAASADPWDLPREEAVPRLLELHGGRLYSLGLRFCGDPHDAEDLVQETFLQAWRAWDSFEHRSAPETWLHRIAARACMRRRRRRSGEPKRMESLEELLPFAAGPMATPPARDAGPLDEQVRQEGVRLVQGAIAELPADFRLPLVLRDILDVPVAEIAAVLGLKPGTVKTRVHRARLRVRKALESALPRRDGPAPAYDRQVCLDLLAAKQESLDRGAPFPQGDSLLCERCRSVFETMDLAHDLCRTLAGDALPGEVRARIDEAMRAG